MVQLGHNKKQALISFLIEKIFSCGPHGRGEKTVYKGWKKPTYLV